ncbi:tol-pal system protein YbgF [Nannocystaceae bacterium ST9]
MLGGCAHAKAQTEAAGLEQEHESEVAQLRRENSALRSRVQNLEERVRMLEQGGAVAWEDGSEDDEWTSPVMDGEAAWAETGSASDPSSPRQLPVVKLEPRKTKTRNGGQISARPAEPESDEPPTRALRQNGSISLSPMPNSGAPGYGDEYGEDDYGDYADVDVEPEPSSDGSMQSYRLVGSKLVEATKSKPQIATGKRDRDSGVVGDYDQAMETYRDGRYADAEAAFEAIVKGHPNHDYADNALYWQGEAAYDQAHYADALAAFTTVVERYGGGGKAADALLKIGLCYGRLGDTANARDVLTQLIAAYPRSDASKIAKRKLDELSE